MNYNKHNENEGTATVHAAANNPKGMNRPNL